ncbi:MAG: DUF1684 domain-containing protein, partial [Bacteroidia bacterium]|nr:DUF1684 domain-containing protein [Bacteroidia bacterium]
MYRFLSRIFILLIASGFIACETKPSFIIDSNYKSDMGSYEKSLQEGRVKYLQLAGLFKFDNAVHLFGKSSSDGFSIDSPTAIDSIGQFEYRLTDSGNPVIIFKAFEGVPINTEDDYSIDQTSLALDESGTSAPLFFKDLKWQVITRSGSHYLRVWDKQHPMVSRFNGYEWFPLNPDFIFNAEFTYFKDKKEEEVKSQLGVNATTTFIGTVEFDYNGKSYTLHVGQNGFTMVSDDTSGSDSYGGGRYIYLDLPEDNGPVTLDFNKLY